MTAAIPTVLAIVDVPEWAHDRKTRQLARFLAPAFAVHTRYHAGVTAGDLDGADLILIYYAPQIDALPHLHAAFDSNRDKLLVGVTADIEIDSDAKMATLRRCARAVFAVNEPLAARCRAAVDAPVFVTPNGVDTSFFSPGGERRPSGPMRIGWAGSLNNHGPDLRGYYEFIVPAAYAVAGAELVTAAREDRWRDALDMRTFYRSLDVYVCASVREGTPNSCLEAAACGVPLLTTRVGNMPELVRDGENGFFIERDVNDIIHRLTVLRDDPALRASLGARIRGDIREWDWSLRAAAYRRMFEQVLAERPRRGLASDAGVVSAPPGHDSVKDALLRRADDCLAALPPEFVAGHVRAAVTIVIVSHNRVEKTRQSVGAVLERVRIPFSLLLVDNLSTPETRDDLCALAAADDRIRLVLRNENAGCTAARMDALASIETDYVMFVDNDIELLPGAVEHLLHHLESHPDVAAAAAHVVYPDGVTQLCGADHHTDNGILFYEFHGEGRRFDDPTIGATGDCGWVNAGSTMYRTAALRAHPFDTAIDRSRRGYFEDLEWCYRLNQRGAGRFARVVEAIAIHDPVSRLGIGGLPAHEQRRAAMSHIEAIAHVYRVHAVVLQYLFVVVPALPPPTMTHGRLAAVLLLDLVLAAESDAVLDLWESGGLAPLFETSALQRQVTRLERRIAHDEAVIAERKQAVAYLTDLASTTNAIVRQRDEAVDYLTRQVEALEEIVRQRDAAIQFLNQQLNANQPG